MRRPELPQELQSSKVLSDSVTYTEQHAKRKTVTSLMLSALKRQGRTLTDLRWLSSFCSCRLKVLLLNAYSFVIKYTVMLPLLFSHTSKLLFPLTSLFLSISRNSTLYKSRSYIKGRKLGRAREVIDNLCV
jgi:hypothetical protein